MEAAVRRIFVVGQFPLGTLPRGILPEEVFKAKVRA